MADLTKHFTYSSYRLYNPPTRNCRSTNHTVDSVRSSAVVGDCGMYRPFYPRRSKSYLPIVFAQSLLVCPDNSWHPAVTLTIADTDRKCLPRHVDSNIYNHRPRCDTTVTVQNRVPAYLLR